MSLPTTIGLVEPGDIIRSDDINILLASAGLSGITNDTYDDNDNMTYCESLGRQITFIYTDELLTQVNCYIPSQDKTVQQSCTYTENLDPLPGPMTVVDGTV